MSEARLKPLPELLTVMMFSLLYGLRSLVYFVLGLVRKGPRRMFRVRERPRRPDVLAGSAFGTHEFLRLKNSRIKLHYVTGGSKDKPLMLFLHGFPELWYSWRFQLKEFSKDYRVVAVDMRGFGDSDKPSAVSDYYVETLAEDVHQLIPGLGYEKCILVGHDWGGFVAFTFAHLYADMVDKLIVCNIPHPQAFIDHIRESKSQRSKSWYMFMFQIPVLPHLILRADDFHTIQMYFCSRETGAKPGSFTEEDLDAYKYSFTKYSDLTGPLNYYRALWRYKFPDMSKNKISPPTLMIWGTADAALEIKMAELSGRYIEDLTLKPIEGGSHWIQQEEPEKVNAHIHEFLSMKRGTKQ